MNDDPTEHEIQAVLSQIERTRIDLAEHQPRTSRLPPLQSMTFTSEEKERLRPYCAQMTRFRLRRWWRRWLGLCVLLVATSAYAQQGPCAVQLGPLKPDLTIKLSDVQFTTETFQSDSCVVTEGDISSPGTHQLIRFTTTTPNIGDTALNFGFPSLCPGLFEQPTETCHSHYHLKDYATYRLWTDAGYTKWVKVRNLDLPIANSPNEAYLITAKANGEVIEGRKQAFCVIDFECNQGNCLYHPDGTPGWFKASTGKYFTCGEQGLSVGWRDQYVYLLDGQWVEADHLVKGRKYVLEVHLNPNWVFQEQSYSNNIDYVKFVY